MVIGFEREPPWLDSIQPYLSLPPFLPVNSRIYFVLSRVPAFPIICRSSFIILSTGGAGKCWKIIANHRRWWSRKQENLIGLSRFSSTILPRFLFIYLFFRLSWIYTNYWLIKNLINILKYEIIIHSTFSIFFFFSVGTYNRFDRNRGNYILNCAKNKETHE